MNIKKEFIYDETNRPTISCHASTILKIKGGFIVAWFGGMREGDADVQIYASIKKNDVWGKPYQVSREPNIPHWNPVLMERDDGSIVLFYKVGFTIDKWQTLFAESRDGGKTWSLAKPLVNGDIYGGRGPVKNKTVKLSNGWIIAPASVENIEWRAFTDISKDGGYTFLRQAYVPSPIQNDKPVNLIQPTIWESEKGCVHMLLRSTDKFVYRSDSNDYGQTFCMAYKTDIPNNNSGLDAVKINQGRIVLACNPLNTSYIRSPLSLLISDDNGVSFKKLVSLESEKGEFSYPAIIYSDGIINVSYTYKREKIAFVTIEL